MGSPEENSNQSEAYRKELGLYWKSNIKIMTVLIIIWAIAGLGCGVLFADYLNNIKMGGFPLGFWFAQQGSIIVFVILILVYCIMLNGLDEKHHKRLSELGTNVKSLEVDDAMGHEAPEAQAEQNEEASDETASDAAKEGDSA